MNPHTPATAFVLLSLTLLSACSADAPPAAIEQAAPIAPEPVADEVELEPETVVASYLCQGGSRVEVIRDGAYAHLLLSDGRTLYLREMRGSSPSTWADVGLRFIVGNDFVELSEENGRALACSEEPQVESDSADDN